MVRHSAAAVLQCGRPQRRYREPESLVERLRAGSSRRHRVSRNASLIGLEACTGAHEWARRFESLGHTVRLMAPAFVPPYRKSGKNDGNDAEAICEAVTQIFVAELSVEALDQSVLPGLAALVFCRFERRSESPRRR